MAAKINATRFESFKMIADPISQPKDDYADIIGRISLTESPVGIDAQYTHAIIIGYLQQISSRLSDIESTLRGIEQTGRN